MAVNAPCGGVVYQPVPTSFSIGSASAVPPTTVVSLSITTRGGSVFLFCNSSLTANSGSSGGTVSTRWLRDGATQVTGSDFLLNGAAFTSLPLGAWVDPAVPAGTHTYAFQAATDPNCYIISSNVAGGGILAMEVG
jgi:hypothetical protein